MPRVREEKADELRYIPPPGATINSPMMKEDALLAGLLADQVRPAPGPRPAPAPEPHPAPAAEPRPVRAKAPIQAHSPEPEPDVVDTGLEWWKQLFAEFGAFVMLGALPYAVDMACTVFGFTRTILPAGGVGLLLAATLHVFISLGQRHFLLQRDRTILIGAVLICINTLTNVYGMIRIIDATNAGALGDLPRDPGQWMPAVWSATWGAPGGGSVWTHLWGGAIPMPQAASGLAGWLTGLTPTITIAWPSWWPAAVLVTIISSLIAFYAEILLVRFYRRVRKVWRRRPA